MAGLADSYSQGTVGHVLTTSPSSPSSPLALLQVCVLAGRSEMCWLLLKPFLFPQERETHRLPPPPPEEGSQGIRLLSCFPQRWPAGRAPCGETEAPSRAAAPKVSQNADGRAASPSGKGVVCCPTPCSYTRGTARYNLPQPGFC